jgi:signal transduction histidine kinase
MTAEQSAALRPQLANLAARVVEEILAQRDLAAAERGELQPSPQEVGVESLLQELATLYGHHAVGEGRIIEVGISGDTPSVVADPVLLGRVLANLIKNALEATDERAIVTVRFSNLDGPIFTVHNDTVMPEAVRLQVFRRSFSTKGGPGRGIGTYSARLLAERYLGGQLTFTSEEGSGTTFLLRLPSA